LSILFKRGLIYKVHRTICEEEVVHILPEGQYIRHGQYGLGIVKESDTERTTIDFDSFGVKKFVTSLMVAEVVGEAPAGSGRPKRRRKAVAAKTAAR
jgi:hypothetical protein